MEIIMENQDTKALKKIDVSDDLAHTIEKCMQHNMTKEKIQKFLDNISLSPSVKSILYTLVDTSFKIGTTVCYVGKKILEFLYYFVKKFPNAAIGTIVGAVIGSLLSAIPIFGWLLSWILMPLCTALGLTFGFWTDLQDKVLEKTIKEKTIEVFSPLNSID